ncbi:MAG: hypothetical protein FLDDKLPJ_00970 [Phycisphaerae bacterium]|nr:hypothetical protein [Phycisphaerae bacterium]
MQQRIAELATENARLRSELAHRAAPEVVGDGHVAPPAQLPLTGEAPESGDAVPGGPPRSDPVESLREALAGFAANPETSVRARLSDRLADAEQEYTVSGGSPALLDVALRSAIALDDGASALIWLERSLGSEVASSPPSLEAALGALRMSSQVDPRRKLAVIERLLRTYASSVPLHLHQAQALTDAGLRTEAYTLLCDVAAAISAEPAGILAEALAVGSAEAHFGAARRFSAILLQQDGRPAEAVPVWRDLLRGDPLDAEAHDRLGVAFNQIGDDASALDAFEKAMTCEPRAVRARFHRATALANLGRVDDAIEGFRQAIAESSGPVAEMRFALAVCLAKDGQMRDAESELARALAQDPELAELALSVPALARLLDVEQ